MSTHITIIKKALLPSAGLASGEDRLGGTQHGVIANTIASTVGSIGADQFMTQLDLAIQQTHLIVEHLKTKAGNLKASEITIGLAVSAEGGIGIATVGAEASIEVTFSLKSNPAAS